MLVLTQSGVVYDVNPATGAQTVALDITAKVFSEGEAGALDILVDRPAPGFYVYYTVAGQRPAAHLALHARLGHRAGDLEQPRPRLQRRANPCHLGGAINLGPDGKLYLGVGDRFEGRSQDLTNVFGKVLRINTDGTVPTDNPFYDGAGTERRRDLGLRLPQPLPGELRRRPRGASGSVTSVATSTPRLRGGQHRRGGERNYGWPDCEGPARPRRRTGRVCPAGVTGPVFSYSHDIGGGLLPQPGDRRRRDLPRARPSRSPATTSTPTTRPTRSTGSQLGTRRPHRGRQRAASQRWAHAPGVARRRARRQRLLAQPRASPATASSAASATPGSTNRPPAITTASATPTAAPLR